MQILILSIAKHWFKIIINLCFLLLIHHQEMERVILSTLRWDTAAVTPQDFLPHFLASVGEQGDAEREMLSTLRRHSDTLAAMCACDSRFLGAPPSLVAAASLNCALRGLSNKGPTQLSKSSEALAELCQTDLVCLSQPELTLVL